VTDGGTEAVNLTFEKSDAPGHGFGTFDHYRAVH
jgi:hypothetical protein